MLKMALCAILGGMVTTICAIFINGADMMPAASVVKAAIEAGIITTGLGVFVAGCVLIWSAK